MIGFISWFMKCNQKLVLKLQKVTLQISDADGNGERNSVKSIRKFINAIIINWLTMNVYFEWIHSKKCIFWSIHPILNDGIWCWKKYSIGENNQVSVIWIWGGRRLRHRSINYKNFLTPNCEKGLYNQKEVS